MAMEFIAEQLFNESANNRDVVSLVEFSKKPRVVFKREPISWVLYNKLLDRRDSSDYATRMQRQDSDRLNCDSNYLPALDVAEKLLAVDNHEDCALSMFFISDGEPTDALQRGLVPIAARRLMNERIAKIATRFDYQLNISFVGFGGSSHSFRSLEEMVNAANDATGMQLARFVYCDKLANSIGAAITSLAESTTLTRTALMSGERRTAKNTRTDVKPEDSNECFRYKILRHSVYNPMIDDWMKDPGLPLGAIRDDNIVEANLMVRKNKLPPYLEMNKGYIGTGVERVAYRCHLSEENGEAKLGAMVAKETLRVDRIEENIAFHKSFCESQSLAAHLASEFNNRLRALPEYSKATTPNVSFLKCSVLLIEDPEWPTGARGVLVERQLDTDRFEWRKWNNNAGGVDGKFSHRPMDVEYELAKLKLNLAGNIGVHDTIVEEGSEEEDSSDESDTEDDSHGYFGNEDTKTRNFEPSDYLQAFSHFTYLFTNRKVLVCDLQGVYNTDLVPPTFELTDPAIHYRSKKGGKMVFGRTDNGQKGIQLFFNSHKCTSICKIMQLSKKNANWKKQWRRDFAKDMETNFNVCMPASG